VSQEKALKEIQKTDCFIPGETGGSAGASIIIERPSGQLAESARILMTQIGEGVSLFGIRGNHGNLTMKTSSRLWTQKSRAEAAGVGVSIRCLRVLGYLR
jgi:hypothetical protein